MAVLSLDVGERGRVDISAARNDGLGRRRSRGSRLREVGVGEGRGGGSGETLAERSGKTTSWKRCKADSILCSGDIRLVPPPRPLRTSLPFRATPALFAPSPTLSTSLRGASYTLTTTTTMTTAATKTTTTTTTNINVTTTVATIVSSTTSGLVVAAAYFSAHVGSLARLEALSARDIYQHPRWRYNLAAAFREKGRPPPLSTTTTTTTMSYPRRGPFPPVNTRSSAARAPLQFLATSCPRRLLLLLPPALLLLPSQSPFVGFVLLRVILGSP